MSSLYKRKLKTGEVWYGNVKLRNGRWKSFNTHATTKREAKEVVAAIEAEIVAGRDPWRQRASGEKLSQAVPVYLASCSERLRPSTLRSYRDTLRAVLERLGDVSVAGMDTKAVEAFRGGLTGLSRHTQNIHLANLRAFLRWYHREHAPEWKPPATSRLRTDPLPAVDYYTGAECRRLLAASQNVWFRDKQGRPTLPFYPFLTVLRFTGLRKQEATTLRWEPPQGVHQPWPWVDLAQNQIVVPAPSSKSRRARYVPIMDELRPVLLDWPLGHSGRLFQFSADGGRFMKKRYEVCALAGVRRLKLHNLRDTFAVGLLLAGVPWAVVGEILGHASVETTKRYYAAIGREDLALAVRRVRIANAIEFTTDISPTFRN